MGIHRQLRIAQVPLAAGLALSGLVLAGCSAAPPGATQDSPPVGPVRTGAAAGNFAPFPVPAKWAGAGGADYTMVLKAKTGTAPRRFSVTATSSLVFWLGCIGSGTARVVSAPISLNWAIPCGSRAEPAGVTFTPPPGAVGATVKVKVTSSPRTRWELRVDAKDGSAKPAAKNGPARQA